MKVTRKIIEIDEERCDGCGQCVLACAEGALEVVDGKAKVLGELFCDGLGACLGECPTGALSIVEREADEFDEAAVERLLKSKEEKAAPQAETLPCGCPSTQLRVFAPSTPRRDADAPGHTLPDASELGHWPVKIRLTPPTAPFLKNADLLIAADCTPVAYPNFHRDFLKGRAVMVGCPKFDDAQEYIRKFADIFKAADINSVTVVVMEVPCCGGLPMMVEKGMALAGKNIPTEKMVISPRGEIISRQSLAA